MRDNHVKWMQSMRLQKNITLYVIEDAAPAVGSTYKGKKAGTLSDIAGFSFFPDKNITTGEGGMIVTNNSEFAQNSVKF